MKHSIFAIALLLFCSCITPSKKETPNKPVEHPEESIPPQGTKTTQPPEKTTPSTTNNLVVQLKTGSSLEDAKALITNSGLTWKANPLAPEYKSIALVVTPNGQRETWVQRLLQSNEFSTVVPQTKGTLEKLVNETKNTLISLRKTSCFGDCPVYTFRIFKDGTAKYQGDDFVTEKGNRTFQLTNEELNKLLALLSATEAITMEKKYDDPKITDLSSTFIEVRNQQVQIRLWKDIPDPLIALHEYTEGLLLQRKYFN
jgi:hypothetical protein